MDLELATTKELIAELQRRSSVTVICYESEIDGEPVTYICCSGSLNAAIGLASRARASLIADALVDMPADSEDDQDDGDA